MSVATMIYRQELLKYAKCREPSGRYQGPFIGPGKVTSPWGGGGGVIVTFGVDRAIITRWVRLVNI